MCPSRPVTEEIADGMQLGKEPRLAVRHGWFLVYWLVSLLPFRGSLRDLMALSWHDERYSHLILIPAISLCLVWWERQRIFRQTGWNLRAGAGLLVVGVGMYAGARLLPVSVIQSGVILGVVLVWIAGFVFCYGMRALKAASFHACFLLLMMPIPVSVVDRITYALQKGSADMTYVLFKLLGVPVFRQGFTFTLPNVAIEVAKECSGIRSSNALFLTSVLAGYLFLRSGWKRLWLCLATVPIAIFKNAVRIVTLSWLAIYVDRDFLYGELHHRWGSLFSLVALAILIPLLLQLQKPEKHGARQEAGD
jgi:exosortase